MDIPALYSMVGPESQKYDVMLIEKYNSSKAGYASSAQGCLSLSFKTRVRGIFRADRSARNGNPFSVIVHCSDWESTGIKKGISDLVEEGARALKASISKTKSVQITNKVEDHQMFLTRLTESVQQMLKLHRMMDAKF
jgi:hypothetical protein